MTLNKLYGHQHELVDRYDVSLSKITQDIFAMSETGVYHFTSSGLLNTKHDLFPNMNALLIAIRRVTVFVIQHSCIWL